MNLVLIVSMALAVIFLGFGIFKPEKVAEYIGYGALIVAAVIVLMTNFAK